MRRLGACVLVAVCAACGSEAEPVDPLDRELLADLAIAQGSATGDARSGMFTIEFAPEGCDCPELEFDGQLVDLCDLATLTDLPASFVEGSGVLGVTFDMPFMTGAIEADGSFVIAGIQDISTIAGPLEALRRADGQFSADANQAEGWVGQRLLGEVATKPIDCRWTGTFVATRI